MEKRGYLYIEFCRIFACFWVIFNHTTINGYTLFCVSEKGTIRFWIYLFISIFCKCAVPIFFAISGAFLLNRNEYLKEIFNKRIKKMLLILIAWSVLYYIIDCHINNADLSVKEFLQKLYSQNLAGHLWYLYGYIGLLIGIVFIRTMVQNTTNKNFIYMLVLTLMYHGVIPVAEYIFSKGSITLNSYLKMSWLMGQMIIYPCIGYYIHNRIDINKVKLKHICGLWILNIITIMISALMTYYKINVTGLCNDSDSQTFHYSFAIVNCITVMITARYFFEHIKVRQCIQKVITYVGSCTFGIYLMHIIILNKWKFFQNIWEVLHSLPVHINNMLVAWIVCLIVMLICLIITGVMKKIPLLRKLV